MIRSCHPYKTEKSRLGAVTGSGWLFFVHLIYVQEQVVLYSDMLNVLHFSHSLCRNGLSRGNVSMYATFLLAENGVMMLLIKRKPLQAQRLYCLSNYRLPLCSVGAGQQNMTRKTPVLITAAQAGIIRRCLLMTALHLNPSRHSGMFIPGLLPIDNC